MEKEFQLALLKYGIYVPLQKININIISGYLISILYYSEIDYSWHDITEDVAFPTCVDFGALHHRFFSLIQSYIINAEEL